MSADRPRAIALLVLLAAAPGAVHALSATDLQVHGFMSQGWVLSAGNNVNGSSNDKNGSGEFREIGVNASWRPTGWMLMSGQMAAVEAGKAIDEDIVLEYGLIDVTPFQGESGRFGARAGRLKVPIGFYNDSRDAVFTRPSVIMPNSVYLETNGARTFGYFSLDGAGLYGDWYGGDHAVYAEVVAAAGQDLDDAAESAILRSQASGRFELDRGIVARIADDYDGGRMRVALSMLTADMTYLPDGSAFSPGNPFTQRGQFDFDQAVLSLQYNTATLTVTSEIVARRIALEDISPLPFIGPVEQDPAGWYLQGAYRVTRDWQGYLRFDEQIRDLNDRHGYAQSAAAVIGLPRHYYFARDWTAGARYDVTPSMALWAEFHYVDGVGWVNPLDNPGFNSGGADRYWNLFTVMAGFRF